MCEMLRNIARFSTTAAEQFLYLLRREEDSSGCIQKPPSHAKRRKTTVNSCCCSCMPDGRTNDTLSARQLAAMYSSYYCVLLYGRQQRPRGDATPLTRHQPTLPCYHREQCCRPTRTSDPARSRMPPPPCLRNASQGASKQAGRQGRRAPVWPPQQTPRPRTCGLS